MCSGINHRRRSNLLGALAPAGNDALRGACESTVNFGGETAAALVILGYEPGLASLGLSRILGLSQVIGLSHAGTVRLVDKLVAQGLVERERDSDDQRAVCLTLSPAGRAARAEILQARRQVFDALLSSLSETEQQTLEGLLDKMLSRWTQSVEPAVRICRLCDTEGCENCPVERSDHPRNAAAPNAAH